MLLKRKTEKFTLLLLLSLSVLAISSQVATAALSSTKMIIKNNTSYYLAIDGIEQTNMWGSRSAAARRVVNLGQWVAPKGDLTKIWDNWASGAYNQTEANLVFSTNSQGKIIGKHFFRLEGKNTSTPIDVEIEGKMIKMQLTIKAESFFESPGFSNDIFYNYTITVDQPSSTATK